MIGPELAGLDLQPSAPYPVGAAGAPGLRGGVAGLAHVADRSARGQPAIASSPALAPTGSGTPGTPPRHPRSVPRPSPERADP